MVQNAVKGTVPALPEATQKELAGIGTAAQSLNELNTILPKIATGPLWGRLRNVQLGHLGGWGTTPQEVEAASEIALLERTIFDTAGANLTVPEKEIFRGIYPQREDTIETALTKIPSALKWLKGRMDVRRGLMTPMQEKQARFPEINVPPPRSGRQRAGSSAQGATGGGTVRMRSPNGDERDVPVNLVDKYKAKGAVVVGGR